jgi:hypothetical protein
MLRCLHALYTKYVSSAAIQLRVRELVRAIQIRGNGTVPAGCLRRSGCGLRANVDFDDRTRPLADTETALGR